MGERFPHEGPILRQKKAAFELARALAIFGGLLVLVEGILVLLIPIDRGFSSLESIASSTVFALLGVGLGLVAVFASRELKSLLWDVALLVVGVIAYEYVGGFLWQLGPVLVLLAGLVGIVAKLAG